MRCLLNNVTAVTGFATKEAIMEKAQRTLPRSCRPFCCGLPGLMRSIAVPKRSHHTDNYGISRTAFGRSCGWRCEHKPMKVFGAGTASGISRPR
jgi:hypothetical protein